MDVQLLMGSNFRSRFSAQMNLVMQSSKLAEGNTK